MIEDIDAGKDAPEATSQSAAEQSRALELPIDEHTRPAELADTAPTEGRRALDLKGIPVASEPGSGTVRTGSRSGPAAHWIDDRPSGAVEAFAEFLPDAFLVTDVEGTIRLANRAAEALFGRPRHMLVNRPLAAHVPASVRIDLGAALGRVVRRGKREQWRAVLRVADEERPVQLTVGVRRDAPGQAREVWWLVQPVVLDDARLRAEATRGIEAKSAFLAVMSHELRTPLTAILGYTELLADGLFGPISSEQRVQLGRVRESSEHLLRTVEEVLLYARLDAGRERRELREFDVGVVLDDAMTFVRRMAERKQLALTMDRPPDGTRWRSDPAKLRQVLVNLLSNAVKFTERGEVRLAASTREDLLVLTVTDTGEGIPESMVDSIFEPFWQADQRFTRQQQGSGLGLSLTKELVSLLGGRIEVRSTVGEGSVFTVTLPRHTASDEERGAEAGVIDVATSSTTRRLADD